jgi:type IV conjugative transfer system protein TraE
MPTVKYTDAVANAFSEAKAWRAACLVVGLVAGVLAIALAIQSNSTPVTLVPANFAASTGKVTINPKKGFGSVSPDYVSQMALGDLGLVLNWTPQTVRIQYQRFLNRMTPELYAEQNIKLLTQAGEFESNSTTQSFYPDVTKVSVDGNTVVANGTLVRWTGEKESIRVKATYTITYAKSEGYAHVASLKIQQ